MFKPSKELIQALKNLFPMDIDLQEGIDKDFGHEIDLIVDELERAEIEAAESDEISVYFTRQLSMCLVVTKLLILELARK